MLLEKGYAKINLGLEVVRKREDGYHDLAMVMTSLNLCDDLYFEDNENGDIYIDCEMLKDLPIEHNLVYKAIDLIKKTYKIDKGVNVRIEKRIPEQAGLGGGSADAAATLRAINKLWNLGLSLEELANLGSTIGSDIPFCVFNKTAKVTGKGEKIEFIKEIPCSYVVLVFPNFKASTGEIFKRYIIADRSEGKIEKLIASIEEGKIVSISNCLFNDLESAINNNEIFEIKKDLFKCGSLGSLMTGSGSTVYGLCLNEDDANNIMRKFEDVSELKFGKGLNGRRFIVTNTL